MDRGVQVIAGHLGLVVSCSRLALYALNRSAECYMSRAQFDIERGSMMRSTASRLRAAGRKDCTLLQFQPTRLFVRCSFCNTTISSTTSTLNSTKRRGKVGVSSCSFRHSDTNLHNMIKATSCESLT